MAIKGDFDALRELGNKLRQVSSPSTMEDLSRKLAEEAMRQLDAGFREQRDPYGRPWAQQMRTGQTLRDTGRLRNSFTYDATGSGFRLGTNARQVRIHQYGGVIRAKNLRMRTTRRPDGSSVTTAHFSLRPMLRFQIEVGRRAFTKTGKRIKNPGQRRNAILQWVMVPQVTIPKRQMVPEGDAGLWGPALAEEAGAFIKDYFGK